MKIKKPSLIKIAEAARRVGCHPKTYLKWADENLVPSPIKITDGELRVVESELDEWLEARREDRDSGQAKGGDQTGDLPRK